VSPGGGGIRFTSNSPLLQGDILLPSSHTRVSLSCGLPYSTLELLMLQPRAYVSGWVSLQVVALSLSLLVPIPHCISYAHTSRVSASLYIYIYMWKGKKRGGPFWSWYRPVRGQSERFNANLQPETSACPSRVIPTLWGSPHSKLRLLLPPLHTPLPLPSHWSHRPATGIRAIT
jgi:hypothetical protein